MRASSFRGTSGPGKPRERRGSLGRSTVTLLVFTLLSATVLPGVVAESGDLNYVAQSTWGARHLVKLDAAWLLGRPLWVERATGEGVRVAIIDTGLDASHPDLADLPVLWKDFVSGQPRPYDDHGHGTHVAGILAAQGHFQPNPLKFYWLVGARGVAPGVELLIAKAMGADGKGEDLRVAEAILWAIDPNGDGDLSDGAHIINLSIGIEKAANGGDARQLNFVGSETRNAVNLAILRGVVVVVSSGNEGDESVAEPGDIQEVISVGAVDRQGHVTDFSNYGRTLDVVAPGVLVSTYPLALDTGDFAQDGYAGMAGTSMAAPIVTGIVALAMESNPALAQKGVDKDYTAKVVAIQDLLKAHAKRATGDAERQGSGVVDARATLAAADAEGGKFSWKAAVALAVIAGLAGWGFVAFSMRRREARRARVLEAEKHESGL